MVRTNYCILCEKLICIKIILKNIMKQNSVEMYHFYECAITYVYLYAFLCIPHELETIML